MAAFYDVNLRLFVSFVQCMQYQKAKKKTIRRFCARWFFVKLVVPVPLSRRPQYISAPASAACLCLPAEYCYGHPS